MSESLEGLRDKVVTEMSQAVLASAPDREDWFISGTVGNDKVVVEVELSEAGEAKEQGLDRNERNNLDARFDELTENLATHVEANYGNEPVFVAS